MQIRHIAALALGVALAGAANAAPAFAQMRTSAPQASPMASAAASRPGDVWTGGGILFAPRYLDNPGDFEFGAGPSYLLSSTPSVPASPIAGILGFAYKLSDSLELAAIAGPVTLAGLRGPVMENEFGSVGWALLFRADMFPVGKMAGTTFTEPTTLPQGLTKAPLLGGLAMNQGGELRVDAMQNLGPINLFAVPRLAVMSDGTRVGLGLGLDLDLDRIVVGANWSPDLNLTRPTAQVNDFVNQFGVGGRAVLTDNLYLVSNFVWVPADSYGNNVQNVLAGIGYRFSSASGGGMRGSQR